MLYKHHSRDKQNHESVPVMRLAKRRLPLAQNRFTNGILSLVTVMLVGTTCLAQGGLVIRKSSKQAQATDAERIYITACSAVEHQLRTNRPLRPQVTLVLGAHENGAYLDPREIRLIKWDPYMFAQGVVFFAFDELFPERDRVAAAKRAVTWAGSTVAVSSMRK